MKIIFTFSLIFLFICYSYADSSLFLDNIDKKKNTKAFEWAIKRRMTHEFNKETYNVDFLADLGLRYLYALRCKGLSRKSINDKIEFFQLKKISTPTAQLFYFYLNQDKKKVLSANVNQKYLDALKAYRSGSYEVALSLLRTPSSQPESMLKSSILAAKGLFKRDLKVEKQPINQANIHYYRLLNYHADVSLESKLLQASTSKDENVSFISLYLLSERYLQKKDIKNFNKTVSTIESKVSYHNESLFWIKWLKLYQRALSGKKVSVETLSCYWTKGVFEMQDDMVQLLSKPFTVIEKRLILKRTLKKYGKNSTFFIFLNRTLK